MPTDLVAQLEALGGALDELAAPIALPEVRARLGRDDDIGAPVEPARIVPTIAGRPRRRSWWLAAAAVLVAVGAALVLVRRAPSTTPSDTAPVAVDDESLGLFPHGGLAGARSAGYRSPVDVVSAYLAEITEPARLPPAYSVTATVLDGVDPVTMIDADHASVAVSLQTTDDSGDASLLVRRVGRDPDVWQVASAVVIPGELADISLAGGALSGTIALRAGGSTTLYAYDLATGDTLDTTTISTAAVNDGAAPTSIPFSLDTGDATSVGLRYWNTVAPSGPYTYANFADLPVTATSAPATSVAATTSPTTSPSTSVADGQRLMDPVDAQPLFPRFQVAPDDQLELDVADNATIRLDTEPAGAPWCLVQTVNDIDAGTACPSADDEQRLFFVGFPNSIDGTPRYVVAVDPSVGVIVQGCADTPTTATSTHAAIKVVACATTPGGPDITAVFDVPGLAFQPVMVTPSPIAIPDVYPTNANGQTYGPTDPNGRKPLPDLVLAVSPEGTQGYVLRTDLEQPMPSSPEEAVSLNTADPVDVPLYASDGTTIIGTFRVGG